ncbi:hypothetical protein, partial [Acinetobacter radioresistens]|uniref:hypothetical protein n=1 Tax=Acinetobacter radioresistens TaxID=40216 RepID=UPI001C08D647
KSLQLSNIVESKKNWPKLPVRFKSLRIFTQPFTTSIFPPTSLLIFYKNKKSGNEPDCSGMKIYFKTAW